MNKSKKPRTRVRKKIKTEKDLSLFSIVISDDDLDDSSSKKQKKTSHERASNKLEKILGDKEKGKKRKKLVPHSKSNTNGNTGECMGDEQKKLKSSATSLDKNDKGKTLLEILELEMRARAIRALLKNTSDVEESSSVLSDAVKSTTDVATKSDPKISSAIAEAIDQSLSDKNAAEPNDDLSDVEIIDDIDLCVTIDDDDDIGVETNSEVPASQSDADKNCDPSENNSEKNESLITDTSEKCVPSIPDAEENKKDESTKSKQSQADSENSKPSTNDFETSKHLKDNLKNSKSSTNDFEKSQPLKDNLEKSKPSKDDSEKRKLSKVGPETSKPSHDDSEKSKLLNDDSTKSKPLTDVLGKSIPSKEDSDKIKTKKNSSENSKPSKRKSSEKLKSSINLICEKPQSSTENVVEKCDSPKQNDCEQNAAKCESVIGDASENSEELTTSTDNLTWSERWAEKQNVIEVVRNSKICANIRKRMRFARLLKQKHSEESKQKTDEIDTGNVEESSEAYYNLIKAHTSKNVDNTSDDSKTADEQSDPAVETSQEAPKNNHADTDITTADHTLTILESDPKMLIIDISDDEVLPDSPSIDDS